jgi:hypothetical protein
LAKITQEKKRKAICLSSDCNNEMFSSQDMAKTDSNGALHDFLAMDYYPYSRKIKKACQIRQLSQIMVLFY